MCSFWELPCFISIKGRGSLSVCGSLLKIFPGIETLMECTKWCCECWERGRLALLCVSCCPRAIHLQQSLIFQLSFWRDLQGQLGKFHSRGDSFSLESWISPPLIHMVGKHCLWKTLDRQKWYLKCHIIQGLPRPFSSTSFYGFSIIVLNPNLPSPFAVLCTGPPDPLKVLPSLFCES